ncbi:translation initiation factor 2 [Mailhella sp.]|uniref:translation initiation factor 2 n=1 Tax=Mailhella sp. TaxID=1981029 RepID=UPI00406465C4
MMQDFATAILTSAALAAGLPEGRVFDKVKKDNLTIARPRMELQFLPEQYQRSGRKLGEWRTGAEHSRKRELYVVTQSVAANVLADDKSWLAKFSHDFVAALPRGANDTRKNWVQIRVTEATFSQPPDKRVGNDVIAVFVKVNRLFVVTFVWRVTAVEVERLIPSFTINPKLENHYG